MSGLPGRGPWPCKPSRACLCGAVPRNVRYSDLGGIEAVLRDITELIEYPLTYPEARVATLRPALDIST